MRSRLLGISTLPVVAAICLGCATRVDEAANNKAVVIQVFDALRNHQYDKLDQFMAQDYRRHCQATPEVTVNSLDDFKALLEEWDQSFSDVEMTVGMLVAESSLVAVYGVYSATHTGQMGPHPPTGKRLGSDFAGIHRIENGRIAETWVTWDNVAILTQLGLFPPPEAETAVGEG
jgi:predicted ester cyclase